MRPRITTVLAALLLAGCSSDNDVLPPGSDQLAIGTWGGRNAGIIVDQALAHVHLGCTLGNFGRPTDIDDAGHFVVAGEYVLRAYPVAIGPTLPALFTGTLRGGNLTLTVAVNDTVAKKTVTLGPVTVTFDRNPELGPCPICRTPNAMLVRPRVGERG
jgi:hypothetical protein